MKIIKIGIDGGDNNPELTIQSGIQRLVSSFITHIPEKYSSHFKFYYYFFSKKTGFSKNKIINYIHLPRRFFSLFFIPLRCFINRINVYIGFSGILPVFVRLFRKSIVFIYDFGFYDYPEYYKDSDKLVWQTNYSIYASSKIIVCTHSVKNQLLKRFPNVDPAKVEMIYPGVNYLRNLKVLSVNKIQYPYFLYVGVIKKIKNIEKLLDLFLVYANTAKDTNVKLVLIGKKETEYWHYLEKLDIFSKIKQRVIFLDTISDEDLKYYYLNCKALLNTSYVEGFCYPVVEALSLGKKVIVNNLPLYAEFKPYFSGLSVTSSDIEFISEMVKESQKKKINYVVKNHPFYCDKFSSSLLDVVRTVSL